MKKNNVLVVCHLGGSKCNGQIAKSIDVINFLTNHGYKVKIFNYSKHSSLGALFLTIVRFIKYRKIVILPGGKKPLFFFTRFASFFRKKHINYVTIGGWVTTLFENNQNPKILKKMKKFEGIYLQNNVAIDFFKQRGFNNLYNVSNFSNKKRLSEDEFSNSVEQFKNSKSFNFAFFARVNEQKGVLLACDAITAIAKKYPGKDISLDIYGEIIDSEFEKELKRHCNEHVKYSGILYDDNALTVLSNHYCLLFPSFYPGEGTPHSIIESFMAGLPVIASDWRYNSEVVDNGKTGLIFQLNTNELEESIEYAINNKDKVLEMRTNCYKQSSRYDINALLKPLLDNLGGKK